MVTGTVGSPLACRFRGMCLCAWPGLSWCPPFACLVRVMLAAPLLEVSFFLPVFRVCPTFTMMLLLFGAVCSVSLVLAQFERTHVWTGQGHIFATLPYKRRAPGWIELRPEVLQKQVGKLTEEHGAFFVDVTLRDGFIVLQVELIVDVKFLRFLKKENFAPSFPEGLYFFVKRAKSIQKHLDWYRKNKVRVSVSSSVRTAFTTLSGTTGASSSCLPVRSIFLLRPRLVLVAILKRMRSKRFCAEDRTFFSEGGG